MALLSSTISQTNKSWHLISLTFIQRQPEGRECPFGGSLSRHIFNHKANFYNDKSHTPKAGTQFRSIFHSNR